MTLILVVDDIPALTEQYAYDLKRLGGYEVVTAIEGGKALELLRSAAVDCMILDLEMPGMDGFEVLRRLEQQGSEVPVIVYTGTGNYERCVAALKLGAYSFIDKAEPMERVVHEVETVLERKRLRQELMALERRLGIESSLVGSSAAIRALREAIGRVARIPSPVLILGESGTGKELVARDLHRSGLHPEAPFVAVNSAALPENLIESELFGHERGAFTGAAVTRKGAFEAAGRGTLFLDEIGELPLTAQAKLLRVLENREVVRLGATRSIPVEARIIAATNRNLEAEVSAGHFRPDLYYRLNVHVLNVPPLRDRLSDIPELASGFISVMCRQFGFRPKKLSGDAVEVLLGYDWSRNNVRELRNAIERMIIAADGEVLRPEHVPADIREESRIPSQPTGARTLQALRIEAERQIVVTALERNQWHVTRTAEELGLADHASLLKIMRRLNLRREGKAGPE
ncbi:MAG TPA: sigma-54 dependent transcriptional regulator [Gemmatimonadales bacterium]|nr:sigma-54 dependent transcriptional regulator [Gemmatimonadales bacterium]